MGGGHTRKFNGRVYEYYGSYSWKADAKREVTKLRRAGLLVRMTEGGVRAWTVWSTVPKKMSDRTWKGIR
jgi:hypothetical protein